MINALLLQALRSARRTCTSSVRGRSTVRFRVDGVLVDVLEPPARCTRRSCRGSRSWPDSTSRTSPAADGRIALKLGDKQVDVRMSTLPTGSGERVVLRCSTRTARASPGDARHERAGARGVDRLLAEPHGSCSSRATARQDHHAVRGAVAARSPAPT